MLTESTAPAVGEEIPGALGATESKVRLTILDPNVSFPAESVAIALATEIRTSPSSIGATDTS
jgi:hypothetical protein